MLRMEDWRAAKDFCEAVSDDWFRETVMSTMEPEVMEGGRSIEGNSIYRFERVVSKRKTRDLSHREPTRRLSSVRRTATPASTLPTVREMSMLAWDGE